MFADYMLEDMEGFTNYKNDPDVKVWLKKVYYTITLGQRSIRQSFSC
jgi:hypothetical protein